MAVKTRTIAAQIDEIKAAITATEASTDPRFLVRPASRAELIEELRERISLLQAAERAAEGQRAATAERECREAAWVDLEPQRRDLVARWQQLQQEARTLVRDAQRLEAEHRSKAGRPMASEPLG